VNSIQNHPNGKLWYLISWHHHNMYQSELYVPGTSQLSIKLTAVSSIEYTAHS